MRRGGQDARATIALLSIGAAGAAARGGRTGLNDPAATPWTAGSARLEIVFFLKRLVYTSDDGADVKFLGNHVLSNGDSK